MCDVKFTYQMFYAVALATLDCTERANQPVCRQHQIQAFPTILVFRQSKNKEIGECSLIDIRVDLFNGVVLLIVKHRPQMERPRITRIVYGQARG